MLCKCRVKRHPYNRPVAGRCRPRIALPPSSDLSVPPDASTPGSEHESVSPTHLLLNSQLRCYPTANQRQSRWSPSVTPNRASQQPAPGNSRYNLRLGALAQSRFKLLIHNDFSISHRAKTTLHDANSVPKTHLVLRLIFLTVVPLPTHSCQGR